MAEVWYKSFRRASTNGIVTVDSIKQTLSDIKNEGRQDRNGFVEKAAKSWLEVIEDAVKLANGAMKEVEWKARLRSIFARFPKVTTVHRLRMDAFPGIFLPLRLDYCVVSEL